MAHTGGQETAAETIALLESRLQRLDFYINGSIDGEHSKRSPRGEQKQEHIYSRLQRIEHHLQKLAVQSKAVRDTLNIYREHKSDISPLSPADENDTVSNVERLAVVNSCATLFPTTASRLTALQDLPIPPPELSASLIALHPRLAKAELIQEAQAKEMAGLRLRTAAVMQRWYEIGVLGQGECWSEWEGRLMEVEKATRRAESAQERESGVM